jgi:pyruvate-formate lyase-activating enzyme
MKVALLQSGRGATADGGDPTIWAPDVTPWDGSCHTRGVHHLSVIIIDERVG